MLLDLKNISVIYPNAAPVLNNIDLSIQPGEFLGIVGKAGSGKTTLLEVIAGLHKPDSGQTIFKEENIYKDRFNTQEFRRNLQIVFQFPENQFFEETSASEVAFGPKMLKFPPSEIESVVPEAFKAVGLDYDVIGGMSPFKLSGGQKRRLAIACALSVQPKVLLLDEPFSGIDAEGQAFLIETFKKLHQKGMTIIMVTHDPDTLCELVDRVAVLSDGKIIKDGTPKDVYSDNDFCNRTGIEQPEMFCLYHQLGYKIPDRYDYAGFLEDLTARLKAIRDA